MTPATSPGVKPTHIDFRKSGRETRAVDERDSQFLLNRIGGSAWQAALGSGDGRSIAESASRVDDARFSAAAKTAKPSTHPGHDQAKRVEVQAVVPASSEAILGCRKTMEDPLGKIPRFTPYPAASTGYLIHHDSHDRRQITILARPWRECGFGK
jgi:hypothetical protein